MLWKRNISVLWQLTADLVISVFCCVWDNLALMSLLSIEISARFHRNRATFHNSLNCEMEWWMDGWMLTMMFLFQAITFRYWLIWTDFWFKYLFFQIQPYFEYSPLPHPSTGCLLISASAKYPPHPTGCLLVSSSAKYSPPTPLQSLFVNIRFS